MRAFLILLFASAPAFGWEDHQGIVDRILLGPAAETRPYLQKRIPVPCIEDERKALDELGKRLRIRAEAVRTVSKRKCGVKGAPTTLAVEEVLGLGFIDEPDQGMDQDLPESDDPRSERKWMGGTSGPTSQGFRHMIFPGIEWSAPLSTFQIPLRRIGSAPDRIEAVKKVSDEFFAAGDWFFGIRTLMWREHLIQDLHQPFHSTQVPSLSLLPLRRMAAAPVRAASQAIANYHYAYEGLVHEMVKTPWERGLQECLEVKDALPLASVESLLRAVRLRAKEVGDQTYGVFGDYLKRPEVDLPGGTGQVDYYAIVNARPEPLSGDERGMLGPHDRDESIRGERISGAMDSLRAVSCALMKDVARTFWGDLDQALSISASNTTGK